jgi:hypothetical protein
MGYDATSIGALFASLTRQSGAPRPACAQKANIGSGSVPLGIRLRPLRREPPLVLAATARWADCGSQHASIRLVRRVPRRCHALRFRGGIGIWRSCLGRFGLRRRQLGKRQPHIASPMKQQYPPHKYKGEPVMPRTTAAHRLIVTQPSLPTGPWRWVMMAHDGHVLASGAAHSFVTCVEQADENGFVDPGLPPIQVS